MYYHDIFYSKLIELNLTIRQESLSDEDLKLPYSSLINNMIITDNKGNYVDKETLKELAKIVYHDFPIEIYEFTKFNGKWIRNILHEEIINN